MYNISNSDVKTYHENSLFSKLLDIIIVNIIESSIPGVADGVPQGAAPHLHTLPTAEGVVRGVSKAGAVEFLLQDAKHFSFAFHRRTCKLMKDSIKLFQVN